MSTAVAQPAAPMAAHDKLLVHVEEEEYEYVIHKKKMEYIGYRCLTRDAAMKVSRQTFPWRPTWPLVLSPALQYVFLIDGTVHEEDCDD